MRRIIVTPLEDDKFGLEYLSAMVKTQNTWVINMFVDPKYFEKNKWFPGKSFKTKIPDTGVYQFLKNATAAILDDDPKENVPKIEEIFYEIQDGVFYAPLFTYFNNDFPDEKEIIKLQDKLETQWEPNSGKSRTILSTLISFITNTVKKQGAEELIILSPLGYPKEKNASKSNTGNSNTDS